MELFVSGRLCLFGEHSDWAGEYRQINPQLEAGAAVVVGTDQGIYARVAQYSHLKFKSLHASQILKLAMEKTLLQEMAQTDHFYSYVAGVAYQALQRYGVGGIAIDNYCMDLPLQKGLSSSAAICVLTARAFNRLYNLGLDLAEEMDLAYWGEKTTGSQCGRLDQVCAYGKQPVLMTFDGDRYSTHPITVGKDLNFLVVDLAGSKDTQTILSQLHQCYPYARNETARGVQSYLGKLNASFVARAVMALNRGDAAELGLLMRQVQNQFDRYVAPAVPHQLNAPLLHRLLDYEPLQAFIYGGKGVGSQGDGTAQLIARNLSSQARAIAIIERDFPRMQCFKLNIPRQLSS